MPKRKRQSVGNNLDDKYSLIPHGKEYSPFITIQDLASRGRSKRVHGIKTERQHDFLSDVEYNYFTILEFADDVVDIREQFPLELKETLLIAEELGITHPVHPKTRNPITMTSDFCITVKDGNLVRDVIRTLKYKKDLVNRRTIEKFEIEQAYWKRHGVDWGIVTESEVDKNYALNLSDILKNYDLSENESFYKIDFQERDDLILEFLRRLIDPDKTVREIVSLFELDFHLDKGAGIALFKHVLARKYIATDLFVPLSIDQHLNLELLDKGKQMGEIAL